MLFVVGSSKETDQEHTRLRDAANLLETISENVWAVKINTDDNDNNYLLELSVH